MTTVANTIVDPAVAHAEDLAAKIIGKCFGREGGLLANPMELISTGMEFAKDMVGLEGRQRKECLVAALKVIAAGKDGIAGTDDDVLLPETVKMLSIMLEHNIVDHVVEALLDAAKGRLNIVAIKDAVVDTAEVSVGCFNWCQARNKAPGAGQV
jgi:hypothetical protein